MRMLAGHGLLSRGMLLRGHGLASSVSPLALFAGGVIGVWFDPSDRTTLYEDVAGTIPATLPGQPVGLMLDKSKGLVPGPELALYGNFADPSGWALGAGWTISNGDMTATGVASGIRAYSAVGSFQAGVAFEIEYTIKGITSGGILAVLTRGGTAVTVSGTPTRTSPGTYKEILVATGPIDSIALRAVLTTSCVIDNISVRELPGYHATQPVAASRPTLARHPKGGRRNLLVQTENLADAAWTKQVSAVITPNAGIAPDGSMTASRLTFGGSFSNARQILPFASGLALKSSVWIKWESGNTALTFGASGSAPIKSVAVDSDWRRFDIDALTNGTDFYGAMVQDRNTSGFGSVLVWGAQLELGTVVTPYQKVTSQYDVTEAGVPDCWGLYGDPVDDFMSAPFPGGIQDNIWMACAAAFQTYTGSTNYQSFFTLGGIPTDIQGFSMRHQSDTTRILRSVWRRGGGDQLAMASLSTAPPLAGIPMFVDLYDDGVNATTGLVGEADKTGPLPFTGAAGSADLKIGSGGVSWAFYGGIVRKGAPTVVERAFAKKFLSDKAGVAA